MASKLSRTERSQDFSVSHKAAMEALEHPRKQAVPSNPTSSEQEGSDLPTATSKKHPNGHKVRTQSEIEESLHKSKFLPLSDTWMNWDVWFQPLDILENEKGVLSVKVEELWDGKDMHTTYHTYSMTGDDMLKMLYLADMFENDMLSIKRTPFDKWFLENFAVMLKDSKCTDIDDHATIALILFNNKKFKLGKGTKMEIYFQKKCVHDFQDAVTRFENVNCMLGHGSGKSKFEFLVEGRVFFLSEYIHPHTISDEMEPSQDPMA